MTTARPFSSSRDPFAFEIGWVNALALLLALWFLVLTAGSQRARADESGTSHWAQVICQISPIA